MLQSQNVFLFSSDRNSRKCLIKMPILQLKNDNLITADVKFLTAKIHFDAMLYNIMNEHSVDGGIEDLFNGTNIQAFRMQVL